MRLVKRGALQQGCPSPRPVSGPAGAYQPEIRTSRVAPGSHASVREEARVPRPATEDGISGGKQRVPAGQFHPAGIAVAPRRTNGSNMERLLEKLKQRLRSMGRPDHRPATLARPKSRRQLHVYGRSSIPPALPLRDHPVAPAHRLRALSRESPMPARSARHWRARRVGSCRRTPQACGEPSRAAPLTCCTGRQPMPRPCSAVPRWRLSVQRQMSPASGIVRSPLARPNSRHWPVRRGWVQGQRHRSLRLSTCSGRRPNSAQRKTNTMCARSDLSRLRLSEARERRAPGVRGQVQWAETRAPDPRDSRRA